MTEDRLLLRTLVVMSQHRAARYHRYSVVARNPEDRIFWQRSAAAETAWIMRHLSEFLEQPR